MLADAGCGSHVGVAWAAGGSLSIVVVLSAMSGSAEANATTAHARTPR